MGERSVAQPLDLFVDGKIDAFLGFPPEPQELRAREDRPRDPQQSIDRPWSQYFCCMLVGQRGVSSSKYPVATKRVLRAILKAADLCASATRHWVAQQLVDRGFTERYDYTRSDADESPTKTGASTTPRTRCGSTPCACTRPA